MSTSNATLALNANLASYMTSDMMERYSWNANSTGDSSSFKETLISELRATGALAPASETETSSEETGSTAGDTSTTDSSTAGTTSATDSTTTEATTSIPRDNWYGFTTSEWQSSHSYYEDIFTKLPGLANFLGANPTYGDMFTNDGAGGASAAINAYLTAQGSSSSSSSSVSTTA